MDEIVIPVRTQTIFQTDNGMRIEKWSKVSEYKKEREPEDVDSFSNLNDLYVGVVQLMTQAGPREFKFEIEADSIEDAFSKYVSFARSAIESHQKQMEELQQKERQKIIAAPASALEALEGSKRGGLILP